MMKTLLTFLLISFMGFALPAMAQQPTNQDATGVGNLEELVSTLESDAKREEFVDNLKTLIDAKEEQEAEKDAEALANLTMMEEVTADIKSRYQEFLAVIGLESSAFGRGAAMAAIVVLAALVAFLWKKFCFFIRDKIIHVQHRFHLRHERLRSYMRWVRYVGYWGIFLVVLYGFAFTWDIPIAEYLGGKELWFGFLSTSSSILVVIAMAVLIWELANGIVEYMLYKADLQGHSTRMKTILPVARSILSIVIGILFFMVLLSEMGLNVMPLLAGAGVMGIAIGFGAQKMVADFLTGFTILLEDLIQVGDVARVAGKAGLVERITMRKIQLRDLDGTVFTVPFSEVGIVENLTKDFSFYLLDVGVAYRENTDEVIGYLREIDEEMRADEAYKDLILEPIEILGVDKFADSAVIIKARIKTLPIKQWAVGREFNRRMKIRFDKEGVEIPFPHTTLYFGEDKKGKAPPAPIEILDKPKAVPAKPKPKTKKK